MVMAGILLGGLGAVPTPGICRSAAPTNPPGPSGEDFAHYFPSTTFWVATKPMAKMGFLGYFWFICPALPFLAVNGALIPGSPSLALCRVRSSPGVGAAGPSHACPPQGRALLGVNGSGRPLSWVNFLNEQILIKK